MVPNNSPRRARQHAEHGIPVTGSAGGRQLLPADPSHQYVGPDSHRSIVEGGVARLHHVSTERPLRRIGPHYRRLSIIQDQSEPPSPHSPAHGGSSRRELSPEARRSSTAAASPTSQLSPRHSPSERVGQALDKPLPNPYATSGATSSDKSRRRESQAGHPVPATPSFSPEPTTPFVNIAPLKADQQQQGYTAPPAHRRRKVSDPESRPMAHSRQPDLRISVEKAQSAELYARGPQRRPETTESWASDESTPTQSPVDGPQANRFRSNTMPAGEVQLIPLTLSPTTQARPTVHNTVGHVGAVSASTKPQMSRQARSLPNPPITVTSPLVQPANVPSVVRLPDGRVVPTHRNDFDNMRRFSVAKTGSSSIADQTGPAPEASLHRVPRKMVPQTVSNQALADYNVSASTRDSLQQSRSGAPKESARSSDSAPRLPHPLRIRRSDPVIGSPEQSRPGTGSRTPPPGEQSLDRDRVTREPFGPASSLFEEATRRLQRQAAGQQGESRQVSVSVTPASALTEAQAYALRNSQRMERANDRVITDAKQKQPESSPEVPRRTSISSEKTAFDEAEYQANRAGGRRASHDRTRRGTERGRAAVGPPSDVKEESESLNKTRRDSAETQRGDAGVDDPTKKPIGEVDGPDVLDTEPKHTLTLSQPEQAVISKSQGPTPGASVTFPAAVLARPNTRGMRPTTGGTARSGLSFHSKAGHQGTGDICPHCFRAGFDCALNLHTGTGGRGRKAFQQFVQSGVAGFLTAPDSPSAGERGVMSRPVTRDSARFSTAGSCYRALGSVAFGESALSRPVTRGRIEQLLEERDFAAKDVSEKVSYDEFVRRLQEEEARQKTEQRPQPWTLAMDPQGGQLVEEKKGEENVPGTPPLTPAIEQHGHFENQPLEEPTWEQPHRAALLRRETNRTILSTLDEASVRSEGQFTLRTGLTFGFFGAVLFAVQILDSGLSGPVDDDTLDQPANSPAAMGGRLAFFWGEALGIWLGAFLYRLGPWILVGDITLAGVFALVAGFSKTYFALNILRGLIGFCGGVIFMFSIGNLLDMLPSSRNRYLGLIFLVLLISIPQLTGPWVAKGIQNTLSWRWLYWAAAIATACAVPFLMLLAREPWLARVSTPNAVHDGRHGPGQGFRVFILPYSLLIMHPHLLLSSISTMFGLGIFTMLLINVHSLWVDTYNFTDTQAGVATTICSMMGLFTALIWTLVTAAFRADKPKRRLHLDEDGYIRVTPSKRPEQRLYKVAGGLLMSAITLFLIAVTVRTSVHWVATALLFTILAAGVILSIIGALHYPIEVYHPASALIIATSFDELPNLHGLTEEQHWGRQFTLSAVAGMVGLTLTVVGIMTFIAPAALKSLGFSTLCVVLACCALAAAGSTVLLLRLGAGMRQKAWRSHHESMKRAEEWRASREANDPEMGLGGATPVPGPEQHSSQRRGSGSSQQHQQGQQPGRQSGRQSSHRTSQRPAGSQLPHRPAPGPLQPSTNQQSAAVAGEIIGQIPNVIRASGGDGIGPGTPPVSAASRRLSTAARTNSRMSVRRMMTRGKSSWSQMSGRYPILPQISPSDRPSFVTQLPLSMPLAPGLREEMMQVGMQHASSHHRHPS